MTALDLDILAISCIADATFSIGADPRDDYKAFTCPYDQCGREFTSKRNLVDHCRGHHQSRKPHSCAFPACGKSFLRPAHLLIHNRIHTGEKPFMCEHKGCGKKWNQKSALKQHMRSHTGEKPFVCSIVGCYKSFSTSSSCKRHVFTHEKSNAYNQSPNKSFFEFESTSSGSSSSDEGSLPSSPNSPFAAGTRSRSSSQPTAADRTCDDMVISSPGGSPTRIAIEDLSVNRCKMTMNFILN
jgi:uncharacterized Zn-finger protein